MLCCARRLFITQYKIPTPLFSVKEGYWEDPMYEQTPLASGGVLLPPTPGNLVALPNRDHLPNDYRENGR